jgi:hypothetical protein
MSLTLADTHAKTQAITLALQSLVGVLSDEQYAAFMKNWQRNQAALKNLATSSAQSAPTPELLAAKSQITAQLERMDQHLHEARNMPMKPF